MEGIFFEAFTVEHSIRAPVHEREDALRECDLYVGDGATLDRSFVRKREERRVTSGRWTPSSRQMARERGVEARIAHDGLELVLR